MKLEHLDLAKTLEWGNDAVVAEFVIESSIFFRDIVYDFVVTDKEHKLALFNGSEGLNLQNDIDFIANPYNLDFSNKKATAALIKLLAKTSVAEDFYMETNKVKAKIVRYINELIDSEQFTFEVEPSDFSMGDIAKAIGLHVVDDEDDFVEMITDYLAMMTELAGTKLFVFLNLRMFLNDNELARFIKNVKNREIKILFIEGKDFGKIAGVNRLVIDKDLCEI